MDTEKIVEVLFDNAEEIRNDVYINIMYTIQQYHNKQIDETDVISSFNTLEPSIYSKIKDYIRLKGEEFKLCDCIFCIIKLCISIVSVFVALNYESKLRR